jgi:hypoxanthine-guanine phosphoribosyltransferase
MLWQLLVLHLDRPLATGITLYLVVCQVEDIVDTGRTLSCLISYLEKKRASSVSVCSLLDKPSRRRVEVKLVGNGKFYIGFEVCFILF